MLDVELNNELPQSWIEEVKEKAPYENTPYLLWDRGDKSEVTLLANPEVTKKMIDYIKELIKLCDDEYIPALNNS